MPTFYFDPIINPISAYRIEKQRLANNTYMETLTDEDFESF